MVPADIGPVAVIEVPFAAVVSSVTEPTVAVTAAVDRLVAAVRPILPPLLEILPVALIEPKELKLTPVAPETLSVALILPAVVVRL